MTEWPKWVEERRTHLKVHQVQAGAPGTWCKAHTFKSAPGARKKCTRCKCRKKKFRGPLGKKCIRCRGPSGKRRQCNQGVTTAAVPGGHWITVCDTNTHSYHATRHTEYRHFLNFLSAWRHYSTMNVAITGCEWGLMKIFSLSGAFSS